jgi:hypothetical protein
MKRVKYSGNKYFYAIGQRIRAKGLSKDQGIQLYHLDKALPYALIAYDKGFRGLAI